MPKAELVFANVLDGRIYDSQGPGGQPMVYALTIPSRALPFAVVRQWKAPQGMVSEGFKLIAPSGTVAYTSPVRPRRMPGQMDLTEIIDVVDSAVMGEVGIYVASFSIDGRVQGEVEFQVVLQEAPQQLPGDVEDGFKKTDAVWVGVEEDGRDRTIPVWFAYRQGRVYVLHALDKEAGEQVVPGLPDASDLLVVTRHKYRDTRSTRFHAAVRVIPPESPEFDQVAALLADRRRDRHGPPGDAIQRWRQGCVIAELTPTVPL